MYQTNSYEGARVILHKDILNIYNFFPDLICLKEDTQKFWRSKFLLLLFFSLKLDVRA